MFYTASLRAKDMRDAEHACVISASTTCTEPFAESADAGKMPIQQNNKKGRRMNDRAKHVRLQNLILSNNEKRFYKLKAERARRNSRTKGKTEGE